MALSSLKMSEKEALGDKPDEAILHPVEKRAGQAFQLRGSLQTILCLRFLDLDAADWHDRLLDKVAHAPDFFHRAPIVLDVSACVDADPERLPAIVDRLREVRLVPVGLQNGNEAWNDRAAEMGLGIFTAQGEAKTEKPEPVSQPARAKALEPAPQPPRPQSRHISQPVRGGQQIIGDADMIVTAPVSPGAEVGAAGNVHVYAPLRGRAFAGVDGDENAMIFCDALNAELVSVAGIHKVNEEIDANLIGKRCRIYLKNQELVIEALA